MSIAAYLVCHRDRTLLGLGKPLRPPSGGISAFSYHSRAVTDATFARALWKYLAECPGDDLALHFDSDPEFDDIAAYREIGGDAEDGDLPLADYLADEPEMPTVYYATLHPGRSRSDPSGIVRRRGGSPPIDEAFTRILRWEPTEFLRRAALGLDDTDHAEIPETEAVDVVLRLLAARLRPGWPQDHQQISTPRRKSGADVAARLLDVDVDRAASDPDSVIVAGLADPRHLDRVLPAVAIRCWSDGSPSPDAPRTSDHRPRAAPAVVEGLARHPPSAEDAVRIQDDLAARVQVPAAPVPAPRTVAGLDVSYEAGSDRGVAAAVLVDVVDGRIVEEVLVEDPVTFPYVPGLLAFREVPLLLRALDGLTTAPDLLLCDGQGIAHPQRCGLASHLGVVTGLPAVGCAKNHLVGRYTEPGPHRGDREPLVESGTVLGHALRTQDGVRPVYVSPGHRIGADQATDLVLALSPSFRLPDPLRRADHLSRQALTGPRRDISGVRRRPGPRASRHS